MNSKNILFALFTTGTLLTTSIHTQAQKALSKEISQEVPSVKGSLIRVVTASRKVSIKSWDQPRVKVTIEFAYDSSAKSRSDADWFQDLGVNIKPFSNRVDILTGTASYAYDKRTPINLALKKSTAPAQSGSVYYRDVTVLGKPAQAGTAGKLEEVMIRSYTTPIVRIMNIMVPTGVRLDIENKYGDVVIAMNVDQAKLEITNGALDAQDIKDLQLVGNYCNANLGNIEKAEIEFNNGTFRAQEIKDLDLDSKSSTIEYEKGGYLYLRSQADNIAIDAIDKIDGRKTYGSIKVDKLNSSFDLEGNNVDIKFRDISPEATLIKINDRYGDVRLPVKSLKNYYVDFIGNYSTVFASFQKEVVKEEEVVEVDKKANDKESLKEVTITGTQAATRGEGQKFAKTADGVLYNISSTRAGGLGEVAPRHFTSSVGDTKGKHTRFELTCHSCTVDFK
jgi:hypothetical protein